MISDNRIDVLKRAFINSDWNRFANGYLLPPEPIELVTKRFLSPNYWFCITPKVTLLILYDQN